MPEVIQIQKKQDPIKGIIPVVGQVVGGAFGGPAGAAAGGAIGGAAANSGNKPQASVSSPVDRRMEQLQSDPMSQLKEGRSALAGADEQTREALTPVLDEAIKKAAIQRQQQGGY